MLSDQEFDSETSNAICTWKTQRLEKAILAGTIPPQSFWDDLEFLLRANEYILNNPNTIRYSNREIRDFMDSSIVMTDIKRFYLHTVIPLKGLAQRTIYYNQGDVSFQPYEIRKDFPEKLYDPESGSD